MIMCTSLLQRQSKEPKGCCEIAYLPLPPPDCCLVSLWLLCIPTFRLLAAMEAAAWRHGIAAANLASPEASEKVNFVDANDIELFKVWLLVVELTWVPQCRVIRPFLVCCSSRIWYVHFACFGKQAFSGALKRVTYSGKAKIGPIFEGLLTRLDGLCFVHMCFFDSSCTINLRRSSPLLSNGACDRLVTVKETDSFTTPDGCLDPHNKPVSAPPQAALKDIDE
jgi:hypothetical protein